MEEGGNPSQLGPTLLPNYDCVGPAVFMHFCPNTFGMYAGSL